MYSFVFANIIGSSIEKRKRERESGSVVGERMERRLNSRLLILMIIRLCHGLYQFKPSTNFFALRFFFVVVAVVITVHNSCKRLQDG